MALDTHAAVKTLTDAGADEALASARRTSSIAELRTEQRTGNREPRNQARPLDGRHRHRDGHV